MIYEYAVEPSLILAWADSDRDYAEFLREYGLGTPRIISSFPKKNGGKLRRYLLKKGPVDNSKQSTRRYTEMVEAIAKNVIERETHEDLSPAWPEAVIAESSHIPFDVVLSSTPIGVPENIELTGMYKPDSKWNHKRQQSFSRTQCELYAIFSNLIRLSTDRIVIVDPYAYAPPAIEFIGYMIRHMSDRRPHQALPAIEVFYKDTRSNNARVPAPAAHHLLQQILAKVGDVASAYKITVTSLVEKEGSDTFHNRCILTEHGGISTGHGIGLSGEEEHTDEATLLENDIYEKKWRQFVEDNRFEVVSSETRPASLNAHQ